MRALAEAMSSHSRFWWLKVYLVWPGSKVSEVFERWPPSAMPPPMPVEKVR